MRQPESAAHHHEIDRHASRDVVATLGAGLFTNGVWDMLSVIVPLYAVAVGLNAAEIGLIVAARSVLPAALSIHDGILMDELGTRRVAGDRCAGAGGAAQFTIRQICVFPFGPCSALPPPAPITVY